MDTQELQDRYDELDNIISTLENLIEDTKYYQEFKEDFEFTLYNVKKELEQIQQELQKKYDEEEKAQNREYWASQF